MSQCSGAALSLPSFVIAFVRRLLWQPSVAHFALKIDPFTLE
jgi:hypothetical protein